MIRLHRLPMIVSVSAVLLASALAQAPAETTHLSSSELTELSRKIDQQNVKIDLLSQQILHLQQEIEHARPNAGTETAPRATEVASSASSTGNTHVVAKGETLTSIARMHKVTVEELQKLNHIENERKLQIGQTLVIPSASPSPSPAAASPSPSPAAASPSPSASASSPNE